MIYMKNEKSSILILYTKESKRDDFDNTVEIIKGNNNFNCEIYKNLDDVKIALENKTMDELSIILIHLNSQKDGEKLWRDAYYEVKVRNKFTEVIVIVSDVEKNITITAKDVLSSGCFAFFQYPYEPDVLLGYILAAQDKSKERKDRVYLSQALNISKDLSSVVNVVAEQLKEITSADNVMLVQLKESSNGQGYLPKILYPLIDIVKARKIIRPTKNDPLIHNILAGNVRRKIFPNPQSDEEIKYYWNVKRRDERIKSWIALPLHHEDKLIGLILLDSYTENHFNYGKINEAALEQLANQAATAIRLAEKDDAYKKLEDALKALNRSKTYEETLQKLAIEACNLVGGLFSYIVVPNDKRDWLHFVAAWSKDHFEKYIDELRRELAFGNSVNGNLEAGFRLIGADSKGITTKAYIDMETQLLNCISGERYYRYREEYPEARKKYFRFLYRYNDEKGEEQELMPESDIAIPIIGSGKEVLGVINVEHELPFAFTNEHIDVLKRLADFAAIAIEKELSIKREKREKKLLQDFIDFSDFSISYDENALIDKLTSPERIKIFLDSLAKQVLDISKADYVSVFSVKDNISFCVGKATKFPSRYTKGITSGARPFNSKNHGHTFWCIEHKSKIVIYDVKNYEQLIENFHDIYGNQYRRTIDGSFIHINENVDNSINALVCIPMLDSNKNAIGVIWMHHQSNPKYNTDELDYFQKYADKAANALLLAEIINFKDIEILISRTQNKQEVLEKIVELVKDFFGISGVSIYEADLNSKELSRVSTTMPSIFPKGEKINYGDGLAGHLIKGIDQQHKYSQGLLFIPNYKEYAHPLEKLNEKQKNELGSVLGIRLPFHAPIEEAIGVLVVFDQIEKERTYEASREKLILLADFAGRHLQRIRNIENTSKEKKVNNNPHIPPTSIPSTTIYQIGNNYAVTTSGQGNNIEMTNKSNIKNGLNETEIKGLFETVIRQIELKAGTNSRKNEIEVTVELIQEEILKGEKAEEKALTSFFRTLKNMAPDILDVVIAAATNPLLAASVIAKKVAEKIKSEP